MKHCPSCNQNLDNSLFGKHKRGFCKKCAADEYRDYYNKNSIDIIKRREVRRGNLNYVPLSSLYFEGSVKKACPACKGWIYVSPDANTGICGKCGISFNVSHTLSSSAKHAKTHGLKLWVEA